jgi:Domain of unknown function (DUF4142)
MAHPRILSVVALLMLAANACARPSGDDATGTPQTLPSSHPIAGVDEESTADLATAARAGANGPTDLPRVRAALDVSKLDDDGLAGVLRSFHQRIARQAHLAETSTRSAEVARVAHEMRILHSDTMTTDTVLLRRFGIVPRDSPVSRSIDADSARALPGLRQARGSAFDRVYLQDQTRTLQESVAVFAQAASVVRNRYLKEEILHDRDDALENLQAVSRQQRRSDLGVTNLQPPSARAGSGNR